VLTTTATKKGKKNLGKRNQVRATTPPTGTTALQLMDATVATVLLDNPPLKEAKKKTKLE